jgi:hypothetical protein
LAPGTVYHFRAVAVGDGTSYSDDLSFTTGTTPPAVATRDAGIITADSARLNGDLTSLGTAGSVTVSFVWGTTTGGPYTSQTNGAVRTVSSAFYSDLSGLTPGTTYYYQAKATGDGTSCGAEKSFTALSKAPWVGGVMATNGRQGDDVTVTISGSNLSSATAVDFGSGITVSDFRVVSDSEMTAKIAIGSEAEPGARDISVTTPWGTATIPGGFVVTDIGSRLHLWVFLVAGFGGLAALVILASSGIWLKRRLAK